MKTLVYKPKSKEFEGTVVLSLPSEYQRMKFIKECNIKVDDKAELSMTENVDSAIIMYDKIGKYVKKVSLKAGKTTFKTWKDLLEDSDCDDICRDVMNIIFSGSLGKE